MKKWKTPAYKIPKIVLTDEERFEHQDTVVQIEEWLTKETGTVVDIGRALLKVKAALREDNRKWLVWLKEELKALSTTTAGNYMRDARFCDEHGFTNFANLPSRTALHELSRKQTTPEQVAAALAALEKGPVTRQRMNQLLKKEKPDDSKPQPSSKFVITREEMEQMRLDVTRQLMKNETLFHGLITAEREKGLRIKIAAGGREIDLFQIEDRQDAWKDKEYETPKDTRSPTEGQPMDPYYYR